MLTDYIQGAMEQAHYEILADDSSFYGEIPGFQGVWANALSLEECRKELQAVLEDWIVLGLLLGHTLPDVNGENLDFQEEKEAIAV